jgi:hypothetical protein
MDKEKQIDEMAKVIARRSKDFRNPNVAFMTTATKTAESLYNAGYRKADDVAEEIFEEIEKLIEPNGNYLWQWDLNKLAELKKKYESEKDDEL